MPARRARRETGAEELAHRPHTETKSPASPCAGGALPRRGSAMALSASAAPLGSLSGLGQCLSSASRSNLAVSLKPTVRPRRRSRRSMRHRSTIGVFASRATRAAHRPRERRAVHSVPHPPPSRRLTSKSFAASQRPRARSADSRGGPGCRRLERARHSVRITASPSTIRMRLAFPSQASSLASEPVGRRRRVSKYPAR